MQTSKTALTPSLIAIVGILTLCPVVMLILGSFSEELGTFGSFTLNKYTQAYTDPAFADILVSTVIFTLGSAVVATGLALFLAYLNTRTNIPGKFMFGIISLIPMMIPHILFAVSWALLLNPSNGMINLLLRQLFGIEGIALNIYTLKGMILVEGLLDLPIAYLVIAPAMSAFDVSLEESSRVCGASNLRTLVRVTLPVLRPAILAAMTLVIVRSMASFAVPSVIGMPGQIYVLATHIYRIIATGYAADYGMAAAVGMSALAASITLIVLYRRLTRKGRTVRDHLQQGLPSDRDRPQGGQVSPLRDRRPPLFCADRPARRRPVLHVPCPLCHDAQREGLRHDELPALDGRDQRSRVPCFPEEQPLPRYRRGNAGDRPVFLRCLCHRQGADGKRQVFSNP